MRPPFSAFLAVFVIALAPAAAFASCADWQVGPLQNSQAGNGTDDFVHALSTWDPDGAGPLPARLVVGGQFNSIAGVPAHKLAYFDAVDEQWHGPAADGLFADVRALCAYNNDLIVGAGTSWDMIHMIAGRWDGTRWNQLGGDFCITGFTNATPDWMRSLVVYNGALIGGGNFTAWGDPNQVGGCGGQYGYGLAVWDDASHWRDNIAYQPSDVLALTQYGSLLYAGGQFQHYIQAWNGTSWSNLGLGANHAVQALQVWNGGIVAAGAFTTMGGQAANHVAFWNASSLSWSTFGGGLDDSVFALTVFNGDVIAGGKFITAGGSTVNNIARWNGSSWVPLGGGMNGTVWALTVYNGELIAGGEFTSVGVQPANHLARWDGAQWSAFGGGSTNGVMALTTYGGRMIAGGDFQQSTSTAQTAHDIVGWDGTVMAAYGTGMDGTVQALKSYVIGKGANQTFELVAGGWFTHAGGVAANYVAKWDQGLLVIGGSAWAAMGNGFDGPVYAIERATVGTVTNTYAGGNFNWSGSTFVGGIARWNVSTGLWEALAAMNGPVYALRLYGGYLYAGGAFTTAGGVSTGGFARWNGSAWSACGGFFNGTVFALEVYDGQLVIGGLYPGIGGSPNLAQFDGSFYSTLGTGGTNAVVRALNASGTRLYLGGDFTAADNVTVSHAAYWDGAMHDVNGGANLSVNAIAPFHGEAHVGGTFGSVRSATLASPSWARWLETGTPWIVWAPGSQTVDWRANATFTVVPAVGYDSLTYQWYKDGVPLADGYSVSGGTISGATGPVLNLGHVETSEAGNYSVVVSNACGNVTGGPATLSVYPTAGVATRVPGASVFESLGPNPAHGATRVAFALAREARVRVVVYDVAGRQTRALDLGAIAAGEHSASWDGRNDGGSLAATGLYLVEVAVDGKRLGVRRVAMLR
jgi:FlgD Ig-like domain